jgi:sterol desaturase/sphingolipid hydroxylase (fatty acid hydroxylase superfamily)
MDIMTWEGYFKLITLIGGRYFIIAGIAFLLFYVILKNRTRLKKIQARFPKPADYSREIFFSVLTILLFGIVPILILKTSLRQYTLYYTEIEKYGYTWFWLAFGVMLLLHDTYFYWVHRLMHHPRLFRVFHLVHHRSTNPSPWAAYAFHPLEAVVEVGIVVIFLFIMPIHTYHLPFFFLFMIVYNVYGHLGYELYPKGFSRHWLGKWINTSVNHNQHHQYFKGNYGLYFLFWDRLMGTIRSDYEDQFEEVKSAGMTQHATGARLA